MIQVLSPQQLSLSLLRLAHQLTEDITDVENTVFIGLQPRGIYISDRIIEQIKILMSGDVQYGKLDITFYRDDFKKQLHLANATDIPFSIENKKLILIDDVLYTGRTIRSALDALTDFGRPSSVKLCVLVNRRFERELPIQPDYCGLTIDSVQAQKIKVIKETGEVVRE